MVDAAPEDSQVAVLVVDGHLVEFYLVGDEDDSVVAEGVGGIESRYTGFTFVDDKLSGEIDVVEEPRQSQGSVGMTCN